MKKCVSLLLTLVFLLGTVSIPATGLAEDTTITFSVESVMVAVGKSVAVRPAVKPYAANKKGVTYTTSDASIATVDTKGNVKGVSQGECQMIATSKYDPSVSQSVPVRVIVPVKTLTVTADSATLFVNSTLALSVAYEPADATVQNATFESSNESVATVSAQGVVAGIKRGSAKITVRSEDGYAKAVVALTVTQAAESIEITPETAQAAAGRKVQLKASVLPDDASDKTVTWTSADENVATVNAKGQATIVSVGETQITATSNSNPTVTASVPVRGLELAQGVAFDNTQYSVLINQTTQLYVTVQPESTTDKSVTYTVKNKKIATVDENGLVTGLKGGKTVVYANTADGSKKRAAATIEVIVPVTGVSYKYKDVRVGAGNRASFTASIEPSGASDKSMTWVSSDEGIATVTGTTNRFTVKGRRWGRCKITGTTTDGGFTVEIYVDVGSLRHAVVIKAVSIKNGKPYLTLRNPSNMNITQVRFEIQGYDQSLQPIVMSTVGDIYTLEGAYNVPLAEGESTRHGQFTYYHASNFAGLDSLRFTITGWSTDSGYYDHNGKLQYNYNIPEEKWEWVSYPANIDPLPR